MVSRCYCGRGASERGEEQSEAKSRRWHSWISYCGRRYKAVASVQPALNHSHLVAEMMLVFGLAKLVGGGDDESLGGEDGLSSM